MKRWIGALFQGLFALLVAASTSIAQSPCRDLYHSYLKDVAHVHDYARAMSVLPQPTKASEEAVVYVSKAGDKLYLHSNLVATDESDTTIVVRPIDKVKDVSDEIAQILNSAEDATHVPGGIEVVYKSKTRVIAEGDFFDTEGRATKDLGRPWEVTVLTKSDPKGLMVRPFEDHMDKVVHWYVPYKKTNILTTLGNNQGELFESLRKRPVEMKDVLVLCLARETNTNPILKKLQRLRGCEVKGLDTLKSEDDFFNALAEHPNKTVILFSHVNERRQIQTRDSAGEVDFSIDLPIILEKAGEMGHGLMFLGCETGLMPGVPVGAAETILVHEALERMLPAIRSKNYEEFVTKIAAPGASLVLNHPAFPSGTRFKKHCYLREVAYAVGTALVMSLVYSASFDDRKRKGGSRKEGKQ